MNLGDEFCGQEEHYLMFSLLLFISSDTSNMLSLILIMSGDDYNLPEKKQPMSPLNFSSSSHKKHICIDRHCVTFILPKISNMNKMQ